jgi:hypothetical protein
LWKSILMYLTSHFSDQEFVTENSDATIVDRKSYKSQRKFMFDITVQDMTDIESNVSESNFLFKLTKAFVLRIWQCASGEF